MVLGLILSVLAFLRAAMASVEQITAIIKAVMEQAGVGGGGKGGGGSKGEGCWMSVTSAA